MRTAFSLIATTAVLLMGGFTTSAQIQIGTIRGIILDSSGAVIPNVTVALQNVLAGHRTATRTDQAGEFAFNNVVFGRYKVQAEAPGFQIAEQIVSVRSNIPMKLELRLSPSGATESVIVTSAEGLVEKDSSATTSEIEERFIRSSPSAIRSRRLQDLIATTAGWLTENNALLHVRGIDDGVLYVVDGIPTMDRLDAVSASAFDTEMITSLSIITGNIPAEFGGRSGAVVNIVPKSGVDLPWNGSFSLGVGSFRSAETAYSVGGGIKQKLGIYLSNSASRSERFLDPVDPRNFNNRAGTFSLNLRSDWHPTSRDILLLNLSVDGTDFHVPNDLTQELAGQRQRQELRDISQALSWEHIWSANTVTNAAYYRRSYASDLFGSEFDIPLFANQSREHHRHGVIASVTTVRAGHTIKTGLEANRVDVREFFTFAVTNAEEAERRQISERPRTFDREHPFIFRDHRAGWQSAWYIQDTLAPIRNLTINAGLRYERSTLPVADQQFSPRLGAVYYIARLRSSLRASFNRLYMPPQVENLLLASSEQARRLSPFATDEGGGGALVRPEKVSAYEIGFAQDFFRALRLDLAYWWRRLRNADDPNVFFNTTIIFPNSVAKGFSHGLDVRLDVPQRRGWSGYLSYTNSRILQTGPINGGLFLTDEFIEIGPGTKFTPDHDQRNAGSFGIMFNHKRTGMWTTFSGRYESGTPIELDPDALEDLKSAPGADLVNFDRGRVKPWAIFNASIGIELKRSERAVIDAQLNVQNLADKAFAYNFGSPFEGTHFGHPRLWSGRIKITFR